MKKISDKWYLEAAKRIHEVEGTLEIDDDAKISRSPDDKGAYLQAWVWVYDDQVTDADV